MILTVTMSLDNDAFRLDNGWGQRTNVDAMAVRTAVQHALFDMGRMQPGAKRKVVDPNGNTVGTAVVTE